MPSWLHYRKFALYTVLLHTSKTSLRMHIFHIALSEHDNDPDGDPQSVNTTGTSIKFVTRHHRLYERLTGTSSRMI